MVLIVAVLCVIGTQPVLAARNLDRSIGWPGTTLSGYDCYGKGANFGPLDYTDPGATQNHGKYAYLTGGRVAPLKIVENAHFSSSVERLIKGKSSGKDPMGDLDYTLRAFPNHHRALWAMSRYTLRRVRGVKDEDIRRVEKHPGGFAPAECYFNKALVFAPEDPMVPMIYGIYLHRRDALDKALEQYERAEAKLPNSAELMYNIGLLHADLGNIARAEEYAARSTELGYPLKGLHKKIARMKAGDTPVK
jgi:tetratricopeptide (TPR) repeat protein